MSDSTRETPPNPRLILGMQEAARHNLEERARAREALMLSLSDAGLSSILKGLRNFREGERLPPKVRKILDGVLREVIIQEIITKKRRKSPPREGPADE
jgi:hypothetical protein